jgi:hypothetical protein
MPKEAQSRQCHRITHEILLNVFYKADFVTNSETIMVSCILHDRHANDTNYETCQNDGL